mgnify:CR=1 FL=1
MDKILFFVLAAGVLGAAASIFISVFFLIKKNSFWRRALTAAMLAELAASSGAMGLTWFCILMEDIEKLSQMISMVSLTVAGEAILVIGLWGIGKIWERRWEEE